MSNPNDHIIEEVFSAVIHHLGPTSPESTFYHSMKNANLPVDNRMLANFIIQDYPWPIGVELRRLFSGDLKDRDKNRIEQILKVGEKIAQFFSHCFLVQLWDVCKERDIILSKDFLAQFGSIDRPSFGVYVGLIRAIHGIFSKNQITSFIEFDTEGEFTEAIKSLNLLVSMRNEDRHHSGEMDCEEGEEVLKSILVSLAAISKYKLVAIREIKVFGPKLEPVKFQHSIRMLNSQHKDFISLQHDFDEFSESHAVLLMKDFKSPKEYLNLSPFIVDTSTLLQDAKVPGVKNGIYMYHQQKDTKYIYVLTSAPEHAILNDLPHFDHLKAQFDDIRETFTQGAAVATV